MLLSNEYTLIPHIKITLKYDDGIVQHHILKEDDIIICKYRENTKISTINGKITKIGYKLNSSFAVINRTIYLQIDGSDKHAGHVVYVNIDDIVGIKVLKTGSMISNPVCTVANEDQAVCMLRENENGQLEYSKDGLEWKTVGAVSPTNPEHKEEEKPIVNEHQTTGGESNEKREENSERENSGKDTSVGSNSGSVSENNQGHTVSPVEKKDDKVVDPKPDVEDKHEEVSTHVDESHNTVEEKHDDVHTEQHPVSEDVSTSVVGSTEEKHEDTGLQPQPSTDDHSVNTGDTSHSTVEETHTELPSVTTEDNHNETGLQPPSGDTTHIEDDHNTVSETHDESGLHNEEGLQPHNETHEETGLVKPPEEHREENTHSEEETRRIDDGIHVEPVSESSPVNNDHTSDTEVVGRAEVTESSSEEGVARTNDGHAEEQREDSQ